MPRFLLFGGSRYYPGGGFNDLITSHLTTPEEVSSAIEDLIKDSLYSTEDYNTYHWYHVVDADTLQIVRDSDTDSEERGD